MTTPDMVGATLSIAAGFVLLIVGGEALVRGAVAVARNLGISRLAIGLILVGFGTSTPELVTSLHAALIGASGIALGNVVGSNIANSLLILGLAAVIYPIACDPKAFRRDAPVLGLATAICIGVALSGVFSGVFGIVFLAILVTYTGLTIRAEHRNRDASARLHEGETALEEPTPRSTGGGAVLVVVGLGAVVAGADLTVAGSIDLARRFGISETIVGLTIVAVGTSLPELATSVIAALRRQTDLAFGNIVGSNIFNILGILGVTSIVAPIPVPTGILTYDVWILAGTTVAVVLFAMTDWTLSRREGLVLLACYAGYIALAAWRTGEAS